ncbi:geranylgeranylglycerol-phosphate geranylgeranyltransferase [Flavivirga spongiicola]|uniref:Geranylgeranylglycerol-phosphate geranylgeranyltransferase n=1 Tax=Flavivirga spongiicola TaxID=421621 RepID=A0ABU7XNV1_9FLAO|nr:geranylgeranylglycerol-phosphate geranylgeranyltransferase [Flavivirga sp. MEBiC05379]MDO5981889.1 geranylgeranylglycerol-phosphate geranylgeranyltransferase [Flavivirga sp. MEBiC05379]
MNFLNLIRWKNLLMIALVQLLIKYAFLEPFGAQISLTPLGITLLILSTISIAAAGNIINDIYDVETDFVNKPDKLIIGKSISEKTAYNLFIAFNVIGVGIGFYISHLVGKSPFFSIFVIISALLYVYATYLKRTLLIGNIVISILVALSIIIVGVFELLPGITPQNQQMQLMYFNTVLDYAIFAFIINLLREIAKDIEDIDGDYKVGMKTLPIVIGRDRATKVLFVLSFVPLFTIAYYTINSLYKNQIAVIYFLLFIIGPLLYICIKTYSATTKNDHHHISNILKLVMLFGMLSLLLYKYILLK